MESLYRKQNSGRGQYAKVVIDVATLPRGTIRGTATRGGWRVVTAAVPVAGMFGYVGDPRSRTRGRASHTMRFDTYAEAPVT
ncbi:hypothetical protein [Actinocatenispora rupis]|uniref:hypothetical protein n=1 Tax=Actinocatenispora rupis TaxID=519421 RepID=UPI001EF19599|nr:hypothetical protein [Actinocatenispora rupis]